jgi:hypothetical protein
VVIRTVSEDLYHTGCAADTRESTRNDDANMLQTKNGLSSSKKKCLFSMDTGLLTAHQTALEWADEWLAIENVVQLLVLNLCMHFGHV